jgi:hypothetical protein
MPKPMTFAILEGLQSDMQREKWLTRFYDETQGLSAEFIDPRTLAPLEGVKRET